MTADLVTRLRGWLDEDVPIGVIMNEAAARIQQLEAQLAAMQWRPIETAPKDGTEFLAYSQDLSGNDLPPFISCCGWHPDAGFCTDEVRQPTHWLPLPPPPAGEK